MIVKFQVKGLVICIITGINNPGAVFTWSRINTRIPSIKAPLTYSDAVPF